MSGKAFEALLDLGRTAARKADPTGLVKVADGIADVVSGDIQKGFWKIGTGVFTITGWNNSEDEGEE